MSDAMGSVPVAHRTQPNPYAGPRPFDEADEPRFFGRSKEIGEVARLWTRNRFTILHGDSGVGKTSLLQAGVIPYLSATPANVLPLGFTTHRSSFPLAALPEQNEATFAVLSSWDSLRSPARVSGLSIGGFLRRRERRDPSGRPMPTLVAIDQFEWVFRPGQPLDRERRGFLAELSAALVAQPRTHLLVAVRATHLDELQPIAKSLAHGSFARFQLHPPRRDAAIEAVTRALDGTGRSFATGAAERLVDGLRASGGSAEIDPTLLQVVCARLWAEVPESVRHIAAPSDADVDRFLADFCSDVLRAVAADHDVPTDRLVSWLRSAFAAPSPGGGTPAHPDAVRLPDMAAAVVRDLEDRHLIKVRRSHDAHWCEIQHPRLIAPLERLNPTGEAPLADAAAHLRTAELAASQGDLVLAERHATAVARSAGHGTARMHAEAESVLGNVAHARGLPDLAIHHYRMAAGIFESLQDDQAVGRLLTAVGRLRLALGQVKEAADDLRSAARRAPHDPVVQTGLGQVLWQTGQVRSALAVLDRVLAQEGDVPEALRIRGEIRADIGDADASLLDLERIDWRTRPTARAARALALALRNGIDAARRELDELVGEAADSGPVLFRAARVHRLSGDLDTAVKLFSRAVTAERPPLPDHQRDEAHTLLRELQPPHRA